MTFVAKVARWYGEGQMAEDLENFLQEFAAGVTTDTPEQSHENMEIYKKFQACVESGLAGFCKKEAITEQEFYKRCEEESSEEVSIFFFMMGCGCFLYTSLIGVPERAHIDMSLTCPRQWGVC